MRCKRDYEARGGRSRWDGYDVARELERSAQPLTKETLIRRLGGGLTAHNRLRAAITEGLVEVTPRRALPLGLRAARGVVCRRSEGRQRPPHRPGAREGPRAASPPGGAPVTPDRKAYCFRCGRYERKPMTPACPECVEAVGALASSEASGCPTCGGKGHQGQVTCPVCYGTGGSR